MFHGQKSLTHLGSSSMPGAIFSKDVQLSIANGMFWIKITLVVNAMIVLLSLTIYGISSHHWWY